VATHSRGPPSKHARIRRTCRHYIAEKQAVTQFAATDEKYCGAGGTPRAKRDAFFLPTQRTQRELQAFARALT
ncbi:MAG: hypothetical protein ACTHL1_09880, partial [Burkholderiaceae bacterium]